MFFEKEKHKTHLKVELWEFEIGIITKLANFQNLIQRTSQNSSHRPRKNSPVNY